MSDRERQPGHGASREDSGQPGSADDGPDGSGDDARHLTPSQRGRSGPKRFQVPWWALTGICALLGFAVAEWLGAVVAGTLGFFAWKLR